MKSLKEILFDLETKTMESLFDNDIIEKSPVSSISDFNDIKTSFITPICSELNIPILDYKYSKSSSNKRDKFCTIENNGGHSFVNNYKFIWKTNNEYNNWIELWFTIAHFQSESCFSQMGICDKYGNCISTPEIINISGRHKIPEGSKKFIIGRSNGGYIQLTADNVEEITNYFIRLIKEFFKLLDNNKESAIDILDKKSKQKTFEIRIKISKILK